VIAAQANVQIAAEIGQKTLSGWKLHFRQKMKLIQSIEEPIRGSYTNDAPSA